MMIWSKKGFKKQFNPFVIAPFLILAIVLMLTFGYALYTDTLAIDAGTAVIRLVRDIRLTGLNVQGGTNGGSASTSVYGVTSIETDISLPNSDSTVTYEVQVTNIGNVEQGLHTITGLPSNLKYELTNYNIETTLCDTVNPTKCKLGSVTVFNITIMYDENGYDGLDTDFSLHLDFDFFEINYVARIGTQYYQNLAAAIDAVPSDDTETTIVLLKNTEECSTIPSGKNVVLDFPGLVLTSAGTLPVIQVRGTLTMNNGTIFTAATQAAINVEQNGTFIMTGGRIVASGNRQALYVDTGTARISGSAYLSAQAVVETNKRRGTVQTLATGSLYITGGTIESTNPNGMALSNSGTTTIGTKDGVVSTNSPSFKSAGYGIVIDKGSVKFYDGISRGKISALEGEQLVNDMETGYGIRTATEPFEEENYSTAYLVIGVTVTFDPNGGSVNNGTKSVLDGTAVGAMPIPTRSKYVFDGWYTDPDDGVIVTPSTIVHGTTRYYAHWTYVDDSYVAQIGNTQYHTLTAAISAASNGVETTITLIKNANEHITIASGKNIVLDFQNYVLSNVDNNAVIVNNGTLKFVGGTISTTSTSTAAVNNNSTGNLTVTGGSIIATGLRQAIYNDGGRVTISGTAYLSSKAKVENSNKRGTVQNINSGIMTITGGTIESSATNGIGVTNAATLTIGVDDASISITTPILQGKGHGLNNTGTAYFYDGVLRGQAPILGTNPSINPDATMITSNEMVDGVNYAIAYLGWSNS